MTEPENTTADVKVLANGPYLVTKLPVARRRPIVSEHGEPITSEVTERFETRDRVALCRCGASANKPFCDGAHAAAEFDGTEAAPTSVYDERATMYEGTRLVVRDDRAICVHAGFCGNRVTNVWKEMGGNATDDSILRAQVIAMVERCPSGAMTYRLEPGGADIEADLRPAISVIDDGPLQLTGMVTVQRADGAPFETRNRVTLCRCGASSVKPLCDGSHREVGFRDPATPAS